MKKTLIKKQANQIFRKIKKFNLGKDDYVLLQFDMRKSRPDTVWQFFEYLKKKFNSDNVVAIPEDLDLNVMQKEHVINQLESLLEKLKENN